MPQKAKPKTSKKRPRRRTYDPMDGDIRLFLCELGMRLITARRKAGYASGSAAARAVGMRVHDYLAVERGDRSMRTSALARILRVFGFSLRELAIQEMSLPNKPGGPTTEATL
jgi:hypothetical protein